MTSKQFFKYLLEPDQMNDSSVVEMEQLIKQFPFFQTGHMLYLKALSKISDKLVKEKLPTESLYISDRAKLYALLNTRKAKPAAEPAKESHAAEAPKTEATKPEAKVETQAAKTETPAAEAPKPKAAETEEKKEAPKPEPETTKQEKSAEPAKKAETAKPAADTEKKATSLSNEERKLNHERLVKDFFEINEIEKYETVATNVAADGSIKSAAAELSARNADPTLAAAETAEPKKKVVEETKKETPSAEPQKKKESAETPKKEEAPAAVEAKKETPSAETQEKKESAETPKKEEAPAESKDQIFEKIAALRKEQEEADKKRAEAEEEARKLALKLQAEEAERLAKEAEAKAKAKEAEQQTTVTETVTVQTVTVETVTTTTEKPEEPKAEEPKAEAKEMSAADKLMARLSKMKEKEKEAGQPAAKSNPDSLIERFLQAEPHLDRNKQVIEGDMGEDSNRQPELYSEKLARLYIQQGHYDKALESYQQLNLKYPEKSAYFAAKIEEINKLMNNNQ